MTSSSEQTIQNKKGEIEFREKLAKQHVTGEVVLPDYYDKPEHDAILRQRVEDTRKRMEIFVQQGLRLSPFLELGAERCQRSLVLANDFNAVGFAVDISFHQLRTAEHFAKLFNRPKLPWRVCCDVNQLPFKNNSFPFVFCYEFLHHFPSPAPIVKRIYDVLSDGTFFFDEEPFKRPRVILYKQRRKVYSMSARSKGKLLKFIEQFISEEYSDEVEHGVIENDAIPLREWIKALAVFDERDIVISSIEKRIRTNLERKVRLKNVPNMLLGGGIEGVCRKRSPSPASDSSDLLDFITCPDCLMGASPDERSGLPSLLKESKGFRCPSCDGRFPVVEDVIFLFPRTLFEQLYPEFAGKE